MTDELEWQTRRDRINKKLLALKPVWDIIKFREGIDVSALDCHAVEEYPTGNGPADYALFVKGKLLGIIEAKRVKIGPQNVLEQAKRYSRGAFSGPGNWRSYRVPFLYATNGEVIWHVDIRNEKNISRQISNFHTADGLEEFFENDRANGLEWLANNPVDIESIRPYQEEAIYARCHYERQTGLACCNGDGYGKNLPDRITDLSSPRIKSCSKNSLSR